MKTLLILTLLLSATAFAKNTYISNLQKITFRTGPGTSNKIIRMIEANEKVTVLEQVDDWSKIKDKEGVEGYVMARFVTDEIPYVNRYKWLKKKYDRLQEKMAKIEESNKTLNESLKTTQGELTSAQTQLSDTSKSFEDLKTGSADYIGLKKKFESTVKELGVQNTRVKELEAHVSIYYIQWFLAGGGVLFFGWLIGMLSRKKKYSSSIKL